jgi:hypothetical protein
MKELLRANDREINHLAALSNALITASGAKQILASYPDSAIMIEIEDPELIIDAPKFVKILNGAARGHYNELVHPLIQRDRQEVNYVRVGQTKK